MSVLALTSCFKEQTEAEMLAAAKKQLEQGNIQAAVINVRGALQLNANSNEARFLMAKALAANFEFDTAATEFRRARAAGYPDAALVPELARAMLLSGQFKKVLEEFGATKFEDRHADAELAMVLAKAYVQADDQGKAEQMMTRALAAQPEFPQALLFKVRLTSLRQGPEAALKELQSHAKALEKDAEAAYLEGSLKLNGKRDVDGAIADFERSLKLDPKGLAPRASLIAIYLFKKDMAAARAQVEQMKKVQPKSAVAKTYEAQLALMDGDAKTAKALAAQALQVADRSVRAMYIAASADLELKNSFQAITLLQKALAIQPDLAEARKLLARAYIKSDQAALALKALERPLEHPETADAETLTLTADAYLQMGQAAKAEAFYRKALAQQPADAATKTALAVAVMAGGQEAEGLKQLADVSKSEATGVADMVLISSYLNKGQLDQALEAVAALDKKQPKKPDAPFSRGRILLLKADNAGARKAFEEALQRDSAFVPAMSNLAILDLRDGKADAAKARFQTLLKSDASNVPALMALADVLAIENAPRAEVTALLEQATQAEPSDPSPHLMLVEYLLLQRNYAAAVAAGQKAVAVINFSPDLYNALGRAQSATGDGAQAQASFAKQAQLLPNSPLPYMSAAEAYRRSGDKTSMIRSLRQALAINPKLVAAQEALFEAELRAGHYPLAIGVAKDVQAQLPLDARGYQWEAMAQGAQNRWDLALAATKRGMEKQQAAHVDASALAARQHQTLLAAKREAEAARFVQEWLRANPKDEGFRIYLGDAALAQQSWAEAEGHYRDVLAVNADNALAANNAAAAMLRRNQPGAVEMAQRAVKLAPSSPDALDTLGMALAAEKRWPEAIDAQRRALARAPQAAALRLKLARYLIEGGKKSEAETELKVLQGLGERFPAQKEVTELLKRV